MRNLLPRCGQRPTGAGSAARDGESTTLGRPTMSTQAIRCPNSSARTGLATSAEQIEHVLRGVGDGRFYRGAFRGGLYGRINKV